MLKADSIGNPEKTFRLKSFATDLGPHQARKILTKTHKHDVTIMGHFSLEHNIFKNVLLQNPIEDVTNLWVCVRVGVCEGVCVCEGGCVCVCVVCVCCVCVVCVC